MHKTPKNVGGIVAQLTDTYRPVGCRPPQLVYRLVDWQADIFMSEQLDIYHI